MSDEEIYDGLQHIFSKVFKRHDIIVTPHLTAKDVPGWDSFRQVSLIMAAEELFEIKLSESDIDDLGCIDDLAKAIAKRLVARPQ